MAPKLVQLQSKTGAASQFVAKHGSAYYKQLLETNQQNIVDLPTIEKCQELSKQLFYVRSLLALPPSQPPINSAKASNQQPRLPLHPHHLVGALGTQPSPSPSQPTPSSSSSSSRRRRCVAVVTNPALDLQAKRRELFERG